MFGRPVTAGKTNARFTGRRVAPSMGGAGSYLSTQADALSAGQWVELTGMGGLDWTLIAGSAPAPAENILEYGHKGVYDPIRNKVRYFGGQHVSGSQCVVIEYDIASNQWSRVAAPYTGDAHGYDLNAIDPATGTHYIRRYFSAQGEKWDGSSWSSWTADTGNGSYWGIDWSPTRAGVVAFSEQSAVRFWNGTSWSELATVTGRAIGYHFVVACHKGNGTAWIQDGNGSSVHWRLNADNSITRLDTLAAPPFSLGCAGSGGRISLPDPVTGKFIVADPFSAAFHEFDLATNGWTSLGNKAPLNCPDTSNCEGFGVPIPPLGVLLYVMASGTNGTPRAYLYRHA